MHDQQPLNTVRIRTAFTKTLKGGWSDESTIEMIVPLDSDWEPQLTRIIDDLTVITTRQISLLNERDNHGGTK